MPHQCLKCGKMIESGSPELLKGCARCGGKKFFFTGRPVEDTQRNRIKEQMNDERQKLLKKTDRDVRKYISRMVGHLEQEELARLTREGEVLDEGEGWFRIGPDPGRKELDRVINTTPTAHDEKGSGEGGELSLEDLEKIGKRLEKMATEDGDRVPGRHDDGRVGVSGRKEGAERSGSGVSGEDRDTAGTKILKDRSKLDTLDKVKGAHPSKRPSGKMPKIKGPATIQMTEKGVYEIDVKGLLEDSPIIVNEDGSYLIHLPSLFKSSKKKFRRKKRRG